MGSKRVSIERHRRLKRQIGSHFLRSFAIGKLGLSAREDFRSCYATPINFVILFIALCHIVAHCTPEPAPPESRLHVVEGYPS